jgi:hypothetical protein
MIMQTKLLTAELIPQLQNQTVQSISPTPMINQINHQISELAKRTLLELGIGCVFAGITAFFVTTSLGIGILFASVAATVLFNTILRSIPIYLQMELNLLKNTQGLSEKDRKRVQLLEARLEISQNVVKIFCPIIYTNIDMCTRSLMTHEAGHAIAALALYKNSNPVISIYPAHAWSPFWSFTGDTTWKNNQLSSLGELIGRKASNLVCVAAGSGLAVISSIFGLAIAKKYEDSNPELSSYFLASSISTIAQHVIYALSAFWESSANKFHDFLQLWAGGINPVVSVIAIALPLIVRGSMVLYDHLKESLSINTPIYLDI